jgi:hypothetical protein
LPGVIPSQARRRLHLLSPLDASVRPLSLKILERPRLLQQIRSFVTDPARPDFVGWSGLPPIAVLFEYIFGLRPEVSAGKLIWDVRLLEEHGVQQYPFGTNGSLDLHCSVRRDASDEPQIELTSTVPLELHVRWPAGCKTLRAS